MLSDECIKDEIPFEIPESWEWARLETVTTYISRGKSPKYSLEKRYPVVAQKCNQWSGFSIEKAKFVDPTTVPSYSEERLLRDGDLLWNSTGLGTLGRMAIYDSAKNKYGWAVADSHVTVIRTDIAWFNYQFAYLYFAGPSVQSIIEDKASGSTKQKELAQSTVRDYLIPFPPLAEQHRIVSRVGELLPLVEEYGRLEDAREELDSSLPDRLRKSVLQEAVEGRLVSQNPADEPASALLSRIRKERRKLITEGELKFPKGGESIIYRASDGARYEKRVDAKGHVLSDECIEDEIPFEIPDSWEWARFPQIVPIQYGFPANSQLFSPHGKIGLIRIRDVNSGDLIHTATRYSGDFDESYLVKSGDDLIGMDGEFQCHRWRGPDSLLNQRVCRLDYIPNTLSQDFVAYIIDWYLSQIWKTTSKTTVKHLSAKALDELLFAVPPLSEQHRIVAKVNEISKLLTNQ